MPISKSLAIYVWLALLSLTGSGCQVNWGPQQRETLRRLEQLGKEQRWRILADSADIYVLDVRTKSLTTVYEEPHGATSDRDRRMGSFSPEGSKITFTHRNALVVLDLVQRHYEELTTMLYMDGARWSPNGQEIAFQGRPNHRGNFSLYLFRLSDKKLSVIVERELKPGDFLFCWGPNGKSLVYQDSEDNIWILELDSKKRRRLDKGWFPTWSPDGRYIAYGIDRDIAYGIETDKQYPGYVLYDLETNKKEIILSGKPAYRSLIWSPDSRYLAFARARFAWFATSYGSIWVMDLKSRAEILLYSQGRSIFPTDWGKTTAGE